MLSNLFQAMGHFKTILWLRAILNLLPGLFLTNCRLSTVERNHLTKFRANKLSLFTTELITFVYCIQEGGRPPCWIFENNIIAN